MSPTLKDDPHATKGLSKATSPMYPAPQPKVTYEVKAYILTFKKVENCRISYFLHQINFDFEKVESFESPPHSLQAVNLR